LREALGKFVEPVQLQVACPDAGVSRIRWLAEHGVPIIHLSSGVPPLSLEAYPIVVIADPADALDQMAADTVAALRDRRRPALNGRQRPAVRRRRAPPP
jgi:hypothetical protein